MKAILKGLHSPDIDLTAHQPEDEENFGFLLQAMIGPKGQPGEESFDFFVCTPNYLKSKHQRSDAIFGRAHIIVFEFNLKTIEFLLSQYCEKCSGDDWQTIAAQLARVGKWEFDDYLPHSKVSN